MIYYKNFPKISCLMVTGKNRFEYFVKSFKCYENQTYPNKELVIVNEGPKEYQDRIKNYVSHRDDVRLIFLDGWYSLGALRNISISLCYGDLFVQWDDDDFNMPERLSVQFNFLLNNPKAKVCYLSDQLHYYWHTKTLYWEDWKEYGSNDIIKYGLIPGTLMAWKKDFFVRYPSTGNNCSSGEDSVLSNKICDNNENDVVLLSKRGNIQIYSYHGDNTFNIKHHMDISSYRSLPIEEILKNRNSITKTLDYMRFSERIRVMGREGLAFIYESKND